MWTVFDSQGKALANCDLVPDRDDLASRGERAVWHQEAISLAEVILEGDDAKRKPLVELSTTVQDLAATISVSCADNCVTEIPLIIGGVHVDKQPGSFCLYGEPGLKVVIDFERDLFRGECLEVEF